MGAQRIRDRVRRAAGARWQAGRRARPQGRVRRRPRGVRPGLGAVGRRAVAELPDRRPGASGCRRGCNHPDVTGPAAAGAPTGQASRGDRRLGGDRRCRRRLGPAARRPAHQHQLALDLHRQRPAGGDRDRGRLPRAAGDPRPGPATAARLAGNGVAGRRGRGGDVRAGQRRHVELGRARDRVLRRRPRARGRVRDPLTAPPRSSARAVDPPRAGFRAGQLVGHTVLRRRSR